MTVLDFYRKHFRAVARDVLPTLPRDSRKLLNLWNNFFQDRQQLPGAVFTDEDVRILSMELLRRVDAMTEIDVETRTGCIMACPLFHEPQADRTYAVHYLAGGLKKILRAKGTRTTQIVLRDDSTDEEVVYRERT